MSKTFYICIINTCNLINTCNFGIYKRISRVTFVFSHFSISFLCKPPLNNMGVIITCFMAISPVIQLDISHMRLPRTILTFCDLLERSERPLLPGGVRRRSTVWADAPRVHLTGTSQFSDSCVVEIVGAPRAQSESCTCSLLS